MTKSYQDLIGDMMEVISQVHSRAFVMGYEYGKTEERMALAKKLADDALKETPQQARGRIVEQAKADLENVKSEWNVRDDIPGGKMRYIYGIKVCTEEFIVNKEKRTVVCLLRWNYNNSIVSRGIAKCAPDDCFNVHIGKAISLRRALGLEVPAEYLNAPQPTEVRVGDIVKSVVPEYEESPFKVDYILHRDAYDRKDRRWVPISCLEIIDDSREGVSE